METLVVNYIGREKRYALLKDHRVEKLVIQQPKQQSSVGNIFIGTVTKVLPGMNAAFVDIGEEKNGYLHRDKLASYIESSEQLEIKEKKSISSFVHQGEKILVQVEKDATGNKGPRLTGNIEFNGHSIVYMPKGCYIAVSKKIEDHAEREKWRQIGNKLKTKHEGILFRTACVDSSVEEIELEIRQLREEYQYMVSVSQKMKKPGLVLERNSFLEEIKLEMKRFASGELIVDDLDIKQELQKVNTNDKLEIRFYHQKENIFTAYGLNSELEKALKRIVWLPNGAYLIFDETEALTIIDVNTGKFSGKIDLQDTVLKTNELAAVEIARQIRLRDLAGIILIDFIDMKELNDRQMVQRKMEKALQLDERRTRIVGFTHLGILQLTRKKTKVALSESLTTKCTVCEGTGKVLSSETVAFQLERELWEYRSHDFEAVLIETTHEVREIFSGLQNVHLLRLQQALGFSVYFLISDLSKPYYNILQYGDSKTIESRLNTKS